MRAPFAPFAPSFWVLMYGGLSSPRAPTVAVGLRKLHLEVCTGIAGARLTYPSSPFVTPSGHTASVRPSGWNSTRSSAGGSRRCRKAASRRSNGSSKRQCAEMPGAPRRKFTATTAPIGTARTDQLRRPHPSRSISPDTFWQSLPFSAALFRIGSRSAKVFLPTFHPSRSSSTLLLPTHTIQLSH